MKELIPQSTGGIWSIIAGLVILGTGVASAWGLTELQGSEAQTWVITGATLLLGHQARRTLEKRKEEGGGSA